MVMFSTARLNFRRLSASDAGLFCQLYTDAETMRFIAPPMSPERALRAFHTTLQKMERENSEQIYFALIDRHSGETAGIGSLQQIDTVQRRVETGLVIRADYRARGIAKESLAALIGHAFAMLPVDEVWVRFAADHTVAEKLVIGVGLIATSQMAPRNGSGTLQIWSAYRHSWSPLIATIPSGDRNVTSH